MKPFIAAITGALAVAPGIANAADIRWNPAGTVIGISGDIEKGDDVRLQRTLDAMRAQIMEVLTEAVQAF